MLFPVCTFSLKRKLYRCVWSGRDPSSTDLLPEKSALNRRSLGLSRRGAGHRFPRLGRDEARGPHEPPSRSRSGSPGWTRGSRPQWPGKRRRQARGSPPPRPRPLPGPEAGVSIHPSGVRGGTAGGGALEGAAPRQALEERSSSRPRAPPSPGTAGGGGGRAVRPALFSGPGTGGRGCEGLHGVRPRLPGLEPGGKGEDPGVLGAPSDRPTFLKRSLLAMCGIFPQELPPNSVGLVPRGCHLEASGLRP